MKEALKQINIEWYKNTMKPNRMLFERKGAKEAQRHLADLIEFRRLLASGRGVPRGETRRQSGFPFWGAGKIAKLLLIFLITKMFTEHQYVLLE